MVNSLTDQWHALMVPMELAAALFAAEAWMAVIVLDILVILKDK